MPIDLRPFQTKAVTSLVNKVSQMLKTTERQSICVLCSPTGSGKTVMAAKFIEGLISICEDEVSFLWVSIGKGELHIQSHNALRRMFGGSPRVSLLENDFQGGKSEIAKNEVVVVNWEKIRAKDKDSGDWKNILMKDGEKTNFREVLNNTRNKRKLVLIIDESHIGATAERTMELKEEVDADIVLEISATPKFKPSASEISLGKAGWVEVPASDVIEEGLIKKEIIINPSIDKLSVDEKDSQEVILEAAVQKREEIQGIYDSLDIEINPLVLIQIPNADAGQAKLNAVMDFLAAKDVTEGNGRLAIWLNDYPSSENLDFISENTNVIQYLVFKQAIDTGWDCPRAHILVKFRESKSETFEIQVVGRILRMPEQKHYANDILNNGYIFTNIHSIIVKKEEYNPNTIKHIKSTRKKNYKNVELPSYYKSRADYGDVTSSFIPLFCETARQYFNFKDTSIILDNRESMMQKGLELEINKLVESVVLNLEVSSAGLDALEGDLPGLETMDLRLSGNDTQSAFNRFLEEQMGTFTNVKRSLPIMKSALYAFFKKYLEDGKGRQDATWLQRTVLHSKNRNHFETIFADAIHRFSIEKEIEVKKRVESGEQNYIFEVPPEIYINDYLEEVVDHKKYIMESCYLNKDRSKPEKTFENLLDSDSKIEWWFKNGINKIEYLGLKYEYPQNKIKTFYPDYLVKYVDGTVAVYETKSDGDDEIFGGLNVKTAAKAQALSIWREALEKQGRKIKTGIVIVKKNSILINSKPRYKYLDAMDGNWGDWETFSG
jgi:type III restriction enzyme